MASGAYPVQLLHRPGAAEGQWRNLGAAYAAVTFLRPQGQSLVLYAAGPDGQPQQPRRIVFVYPILPGDAFERLDGATLSWAEPECGDEFALCFLDDAACGAVCGAIAPVVRTPAVDGIADILAGLRVAREEGAPAPGGADIAARLARLSIGRP
ncbi:hypothetical protein SEVIR_8G006000v4 [Setaria viridis]|uniref:Uncharacterized protein n=1 Tax=Setaria viridis TaxID=4556 RepID=A0A4U6TEC7_SETVI|nr:uncharacterized protein LOC117833077 [Setaria viridis]TKV98928.1 hypothetical protein SEVIR_8G006000v2 [Setaria viridis]